MGTSRQALDEKALLDLLNWELAAYEECDGCHFTAIRAASEDEAGCNWADADLEAGAQAAPGGQVIAHHVVDETRRAFNLAH